METGARLLTRNFVLLSAGHFLQALGMTSMVLLPLYLDHLGATRGVIGLVLATAACGGLLTRPLVGYLLDHWGRRQTVALGTALSVAALLALGTVGTISWWLYAVQFVFGMGIGAMFTGYFTFASDHIPASRRTEGIALFGVFGLLPLGLNGLTERLGVSGGELRFVFPVVGLVVLLSIVALVLVPDAHAPTGASTDSRRTRMGRTARALASVPLLPVWTATALFSSAVAVFMAFATVTAASRGVAYPATLWLVYALSAVGVRVLGGGLPDRVGPSRFVAPALALYGAGLVVTAFASSQGWFLLAGLLAGAGHGYCFPILASQVVGRSPEVLRGAGFAVFTGLWDLCQISVRPLFGLVADRAGDARMYLSLVAIVAVGLVVWVALEARHTRASSAGRVPAA